MERILVVSHFSIPQWPLVNKIMSISKSLGIDHEHCSNSDKLIQVMSSLPRGQKVLFFTDEGMVNLLKEIETNEPSLHMETVMFISSRISTAASKIEDLNSVKCLIGIEEEADVGRDLAILMKKFNEDNILNLDKYLSFGASLHTKIIDSSESKRSVLEELASFILSLGDPEYSLPFDEYSRRVTEVVDELVINSIFHGNPRLRDTDRSKSYKLNAEEEITITWGYDGEYFGVSVRDPHGSLNRNTIIKYLSSQEGKDNILVNASGGLGLKFVFERAHQFVANVRSEQVTELIVLVRFESRLKEFDKRKKSFFYFSDI